MRWFNKQRFGQECRTQEISDIKTPCNDAFPWPAPVIIYQYNEDPPVNRTGWSGFSLFSISAMNRKIAGNEPCHCLSMHLFRWQRLQPWPCLVNASCSLIHIWWGLSKWRQICSRIESELKNDSRSHFTYAKKNLQSLLNIHLHLREGIRALHHGL